MLSMMRHQHH